MGLELVPEASEGTGLRLDLDLDLERAAHLSRLATDPAYAARSSDLWRTLPLRALSASSQVNNSQFRATPAITSLCAWYDTMTEEMDGGIAILAGPPGTGKTVAACWLAANRLLRSEQDIRFVTAMELVRTMSDVKARKALIAEAGDATIIDDLGAEQVTKASANAWQAALDELVDAIYRSCGIAIITTNAPFATFKKRYGARVCDRLAEVGSWIPVTGKSLRGSK